MSQEIGNPAIRRVIPKNILSFGSDFEGIDLQPLNVVIGPNGCGKSNLIEVINLMRASPKDWQEVTRKGGGAEEWIWKGNTKDSVRAEVIIDNPKGNQPLSHSIAFQSVSQSFRLKSERIEDECPYPEATDEFYYQFDGGDPLLNSGSGRIIKLTNSINLTSSILAQRRDPEHYPELHHLASTYEKIRIYRDWTFGHSHVLREPQRADMRSSPLAEDFSNLALFLNHLKRWHPAAKKMLLEELKELYGGITDFDVSVQGGTVQVFILEGDYPIPATRLSDGTLHYLCLLAILCDPEPPPLICIEEPELGLHPDVVLSLARLLKKASERTQLIVTTHSTTLVDAMTEIPEAVIVCEKRQGQTAMERLNREDLQSWLKDYGLGRLWSKGVIGGTRW
jgi:predicted ATPase